MTKIETVEELKTFLINSPIANFNPEFLSGNMTKLNSKQRIEFANQYKVIEESLENKPNDFLNIVALKLNLSSAFCKNIKILDYLFSLHDEEILCSLINNPTLDPHIFYKAAQKLHQLGSSVFNGAKVKDDFPDSVVAFFSRIMLTPKLRFFHMAIARSFNAPYKAYLDLTNFKNPEIEDVLVANTFMPLNVIDVLKERTLLDEKGKTVMSNGRPVYKYDEQIIKNMLFRYPDLEETLLGGK